MLLRASVAVKKARGTNRLTLHAQPVDHPAHVGNGHVPTRMVRLAQGRSCPLKVRVESAILALAR